MKTYSATIEVTLGTFQVTAVEATCSGVVPVNISVNTSNPNFIQDLQDALNAIPEFQLPETQGMELFSVTGDTTALAVSTKCSSCAFINIVYNSFAFYFSDTGTCAEADVKILANVDCSNLECLSFTDTTKIYDAITNPTGYGYLPNYPSLADIDHIEFYLVDVTNAMNTYKFVDSGYMPNAAGNNNICLEATSFLKVGDATPLAAFVGGNSYILQYRVYTDNGEFLANVTSSLVFPCCSEVLPSDLTTNFRTIQKIGCGSFDFEDTTGVYEEEDNPGGYGTPNPDFDDISATEIKITLEDGSVITIIDFIPTEENPIKNITAEMLGYTDGNIPDQIVDIQYSVYVAGLCRVGYKEQRLLFHCNTGACIKLKARVLLVNECSSCQPSAEVATVESLILRYEHLLLASKSALGCATGAIQQLFYDCSKDCPDC